MRIVLRAALVAGALALAGCPMAGSSTLGAALGFGASALKLDDDVFEWWAERRAAERPPAAHPGVTNE